MSDRPAPTRIMYRQGGGWYTWERHNAGRQSPDSPIAPYNRGDNDRIAAVEFSDGWVFDAVSGWQKAESA